MEQRVVVSVFQVVKEMVEVDQIIVDRIVDVTVMVQRQIPSIQTISKTVEILQIQFLDRVVDVPVDEHIDDSCDCTSDFQMEVVSKERYARSLMTVSLKCV